MFGKFASIGMVVISLMAGFISFYMLNDWSKQKRREYLQELISQLINFVIFIWVGKIIIHLQIFMKDPLAVLAYPSRAYAFYLAILFSGVFIIYKAKRKTFPNVRQFLLTFIHVFLTASFVFTFIQVIRMGNRGLLGYLAVLLFLHIAYLLMYKTVTENIIFTTMLWMWTIGVSLLLMLKQDVDLFGYMIHQWFIWTFLFVNVVIMIMNRKRDINGRN